MNNKKVSCLSITLLFFLFCLTSYSQVYLPLTNNMVIPSNSNIKILGGNYTFTNNAGNGVIQIYNKTNITLDGDSVTVDGVSYNGFMIYISNSSNITIKNFEMVKDYYYAIHVDSSTNVAIYNCNLSYNKKDTIGWCTISDNETNPYGGGLFMNHVRAAAIYSDTMQYQNDGVAMYNCDSILVHDNVLSWNTAYGIRMYHTDTSKIYNNDASHVNRYTDPSDCADILLYFSSHNAVTNNIFNYGGDDIFTNDNITLPNARLNFHSNNYFANNQCLYSPHNAIESVFTDGNIFKRNNASNSNYGMWCGYAINTIIDSNMVSNNSADGLALEHGLHNTITNDTFNNNVNGIHLFLDAPASAPYTDHDSHGYYVANNVVSGNTDGILLKNTYLTLLFHDSLSYNSLGVEIDSAASVNDTILNCIFFRNATYNIANYSVDSITAYYNSYCTNDSSIIDCQIYDYYDNAAEGKVFWQPFSPAANNLIQVIPPPDLCEIPAYWTTFVQDGLPTTLTWDTTDFIAGSESLRMNTESGFQIREHYYPSGSASAEWNLSTVHDIVFSFKAIDTNQSGYQQLAVRIGNSCGGYYQYDAINPNIITSSWQTDSIPIAGNANWILSTVGSVSLSTINYLEVITDTWGYGFTFWLDGVGFYPPLFGAVHENSSELPYFNLFPNPNNGTFEMDYNLKVNGNAKLIITDVLGNNLSSYNLLSTTNKLTINQSGLTSGLYYYYIISDNQPLKAGKISVIK